MLTSTDLSRILASTAFLAHVLLSAVVYAQQEPYPQVPLSHGLTEIVTPVASNDFKRAITPELSEYVEGLLKDAGVPGLALGVVHANGESEYGAWGIRSEEGEEMTTDVCFPAFHLSFSSFR